MVCKINTIRGELQAKTNANGLEAGQLHLKCCVWGLWPEADIYNILVNEWGVNAASGNRSHAESIFLSDTLVPIEKVSMPFCLFSCLHFTLCFGAGQYSTACDLCCYDDCHPKVVPASLDHLPDVSSGVKKGQKPVIVNERGKPTPSWGLLGTELLNNSHTSFGNK